ncbi:hypothetical protein EDD11_002834 [Mortierella claussenii]|nr:hypothetical protein EDD11_002834 [Mortierella claussenii]
MIPTPPKTPDAKNSLQFASSMSRSISLGSSDHRHNMNAVGVPSHHQNGPARPNLPGIASLHKSQQQQQHSGSYLPAASSMATIIPPASSPTTSLASSTSPHLRMVRSSSSMAITSGGLQSPYNGHMSESQQQHQALNYALPRPNLTRHESLGSHSGRFVRGHEHHRSLDIDPFSALAELANLAEQHREMPGSGRQGTGHSNSDKSGKHGNSSPATTTTAVIAQSKEGWTEIGPHHRRGSNHSNTGGESMSRSGSSSSAPEVGDIEDAVIKTMIERPLPPASAPGALAMGRRFSTLGHVKEEEHEHSEAADENRATAHDGEHPYHQQLQHQHQHQHHHSYHIDIRNKSSSPIGHSKSYSADHDFGSASASVGRSVGRSLSSSSCQSKRLSMDFSTSEPASDCEEEEGNMLVEEAARHSSVGYHEHHGHSQQQHGFQGQERKVSSTSMASRPSAPYMAMRRGSVRELMAIDNLCLSSEEVEHC